MCHYIPSDYLLEYQLSRVRACVRALDAFQPPGGHIHNEGGKKTSHHGGEEGSDDHGEGEEGRVQPVGHHKDYIDIKVDVFSEEIFRVKTNLSVSPYCSP